MTAKLAHLVTAELRFLAACSYVPAGEAGIARQERQLANALSNGHQPEALWAGIQRHRIFALAEHVLRQHHMQHVMGKCFAPLQTKARRTRLQNLRLLSAAADFSASLSAASITYRFLKGPQLSQKIYGDAGLRHSKDLDVIVRPEQVRSAIGILQAKGWEFTDGHFQQPGHFALQRHFALHHRQKNISLELHWRIELARSPMLEEKWWSLWHPVPAEVTPAEFLYLCLHGTTHAWNRLKWLGDLAAIIDRQPQLWPSSDTVSAALGLDLARSQAILLLRVLFEIEPSTAAAEILRRQPRAYALATVSLQEMQAAQVRRGMSVRRSWAVRRYSATVETRHSLLERLEYSLVFWLTHGGPVLLRYTAFLAAAPWALAASIRKRLFYRKMSTL